VKKKTTTTTRTKHVATKKITRGYYIKVGTFANPSTAIRNIKAIKLNYKTTKIKGGLTRVLIGPFYSQRDAQNHLAKAKANVASDAYIAKIK
jgi:cell division protein FtsN